MRRIGKWVGLGVLVISAFGVGSLRSGDGADPYLDEFRVVTSIPAHHGRLVTSGVVTNSVMLAFEDDEGTIRIYDYLKYDEILQQSIIIYRD